MNRYPDWLLPVLALVVVLLVVLRILLRRVPSVDELIAKARRRRPVTVDVLAEPRDLADTLSVLSVACPECGAAPRIECTTVNGWGCHLARYQRAELRRWQDAKPKSG